MIRSELAQNSIWEVGTIRARLNPRSAIGTMSVAANVTSAQGIPLITATSIGHSLWSRRGAAETEAYKDGVSIGTSATASSGVLALPFYILGSSTTGPALNQASSRQVVAVHWGLGLTSAEALAIYSALYAYATSVGAL